MRYEISSAGRRAGRTHANILAAIMLLKTKKRKTVYFGKHQLKTMDIAIKMGIKPSQIQYGNEPNKENQ